MNNINVDSDVININTMTSASDEKWRPFNCFFQSREQVVVRRGQIRRIGWVIKILEARVGHFLLGCKRPEHCRTRTRLTFRDVFPSKCPSDAPADMSNTPHSYFGPLEDNQ